MLKRIISLVLLFTLLLQVLPLRQVGYVLFSNQLNEELPHSIEDGKAPLKKFADLDDHLLFAGNTSYLLSLFSSSIIYVSYTCNIPANHAGEIHTPPPNQA